MGSSLANRLNGRQENAWRWLFSLLLGYVVGQAMYLQGWCIKTIYVINYRVSFFPPENPLVRIAVIALTLFIFLGLHVSFHRRWLREQPIQGFPFALALSPLILLFPLSWMPKSFLSPLAFVALSSLGVFRLAAIWPTSSSWPAWKGGPRLRALTLGILLLAVALCVIFFTFLQYRALGAMILGYADWAIYFNCIDNTLRGNWFYSNELGRNYLGHHFMPGTVLLLAPYVWLFRSAMAFFVLNALVLHLGALFLYALARKRGASRGMALTFALLSLLHPSLSQMTLAIFYGFHPVYLTLPLIALAFLLYEYHRVHWAAFTVLVTFTIQETVPVFFVGLGFVLLWGGCRRHGLILLVSSLAYFFLVTQIVSPWISGREQYDFLSRFSHLGSSFSQIVLSPVLKPAVFWATLMRSGNFYFLALIILPVFPLVLLRPFWLLAAAPTMLFVCLQKSSELQTIALQYQSETVMLVLLIALHDLTAPESQGRFRLFLWGLSSHRRSPAAAWAGLLALAVSASLAHVFFGLGIVGKNLVWEILRSPSYLANSEELARHIPPGRTLSATPRLAAHFFLRNEVFIALAGVKVREFVALDLDDELGASEPYETFRYQLLSSGQYRLVWTGDVHDHRWLLWQRRVFSLSGPLPAASFSMTTDEWEKMGRTLATGFSPLQARVIVLPYDPFRQGWPIEIFYRIKSRVSYDLRLWLSYTFDKNGAEVTSTIAHHFGNGLWPAYLVKPDEVVRQKLLLPLPPQIGQVRFYLQVEKKPAPAAVGNNG